MDLEKILKDFGREVNSFPKDVVRLSNEFCKDWVGI